MSLAYSEVCRLRGLSIPSFAYSEVCGLRGLSIPSFADSEVCRLRGLSILKVCRSKEVLNFRNFLLQSLSIGHLLFGCL